MNIEKISNDIYLFKKQIKKEDCDYIIEIIEKYPAWEDAVVFGDIENYRKTKVDYLSNRYGLNSELYLAHSILGYNFKVAFENLTSQYETNGKSFLFYTGDEGIQILKYQKNEYYNEHIDGGPQVKRIHSCVMFLNEEYKGGEIYFSRQNLKFKGETGDIIFFPSTFTHPHTACLLEDGIKYTGVIWSF